MVWDSEVLAIVRASDHKWTYVEVRFKLDTVLLHSFQLVANDGSPGLDRVQERVQLSP